MSPTRKKFKLAEIRVGIFVIASFVILALAVIYISAGSSLLGPSFRAVTYLPNVGGLKAGAPVQLAGVEVGSVDQVRILPRDMEPKNRKNQEVAGRTESVHREIQARRDKQALYEEEMKRLTARSEELKQADKVASQEYKKLQTTLADMRVTLENNLNLINNLSDEEIRLRQSIQNVEVLLKVDQRYRSWIREDSEVGVGSIGLLGDKYIDITLGRSETPAGINERGHVVITGKMQADFRELITGIDDVVGNFGVLSQRFRNLTNKLEEGSVAQFIGDRSFYDNLNTTLAEANTTLRTVTELIREIKEGRGTIGRLIADDRLYNQINTATEETSQLLKKVNSGEGALGKFIANPGVYDKADAVLASADTIASRISRGEGTLGKLSKDEALYERTKLAMEKFANLVDEVEQGKGTLGMLVKDKALYDNLTQVSSEMVKLLYDFRQDPKKYLTIRFKVF